MMDVNCVLSMGEESEATTSKPRSLAIFLLAPTSRSLIARGEAQERSGSSKNRRQAYFQCCADLKASFGQRRLVHQHPAEQNIVEIGLADRRDVEAPEVGNPDEAVVGGAVQRFAHRRQADLIAVAKRLDRQFGAERIFADDDLAPQPLIGGGRQRLRFAVEPRSVGHEALVDVFPPRPGDRLKRPRLAAN
jgi:hypothetical protein